MCVLLPIMVIWILINSIPCIESQSVFPTQAEQVNLLTNVHELFEQIKYSAMAEQTALDNSMTSDLELIMDKSLLIISTLEELTILKLTSRSNAVCVFDAKENIEAIAKEAVANLDGCAKTGKETLTANSLNLTTVLESAIRTGEGFLDKLNLCSEKRGLAVIACYKKIIQNDVLPVKGVLSDAIDNHEKGHIKTFGLKTAFNECTENITKSFRDQLNLALEQGLNCS